MNIIKELRAAYPKYGFSLHDDGVIVTLRGGHKYLMTLEESRQLLQEINAHLNGNTRQQGR